MPVVSSQTIVSEFIGTFILVMTVCCASMGGSSLASISIACSLMVGIYSLGNVSGANFNPAVSGGLFLSNLMGHSGLKDFDIKLTSVYKIVQLLAALFAALVAGGVYGCPWGGSASHITIAANTTDTSTNLVLNLTASFPPLGPQGDYELWSALLAEVFYTCMLVFTVLNTATNPTKADGPNHYFGLSIGFVIMAGANAIGHVSGCSLNPAVSFGLTMGSIIFGSAPSVGTAILNWFLYSLAEGLGCVLAAAIFHFVRAANIKKRDNAKVLAESMASKCVAEFTGTFYLILTVCLVCSAPAGSAVLGVVGIASSLMVMIYSLGAVSGANFNPAVTLALGLRGELDWGVAAAYWASQLAGGVFAACMAAAIESGNKAAGGGYNVALVASTDTNTQITVIAGNGTWGQIILAEWFYTFLLVLVVLNAAVANGPNHYFGLAIGMCVTVGGIAVGGLTGGCFNPAVSLALAFGGVFAQGTGNNFAAFLGYWVAQLLGAATAAGVTAAAQGPAKEEQDAGDAEEDMELLNTAS